MLRRTFFRELAALGLAASGAPGPVVTEDDLAPLPAAARRYLRFMRVVGRARDTTFLAHLRGRFRPRRDGRWLAADIWQFDSQPDLARVFHMTLRMMGVPVYGRDTYVAGQGRMRVRPLDLFTVEDHRGRELDVGELVTYLDDCVLRAPSMLLAPGVAFAGVDDAAFDVSLTDRGITVTARVLLDERGAPRDLETTDRYFGPTRARTRWTTPVEGWRDVDGRMLPSRGRAVWHFADGEYAYAEIAFEAGDVVFGASPRAGGASPR
jgi:hypothetical protein